MKACRKIGFGPALNGKQDHRLDGSERVVKAHACEDENAGGQSPFPRARGQSPFPRAWGQSPFPRAWGQSPFPRAWGQSPFPRVSLTLAGFVCVLRRQKSKYKRFMFMG